MAFHIFNKIVLNFARVYVGLFVLIVSSGFQNAWAQDYEDDEFEFSFEQNDSDNEERESGLNHTPSRPSWQNTLLQAKHITFRHDVAYAFHPRDIVVNRSSARLQLGWLVTPRWFVRFDGTQSYDAAFSDPAYDRIADIYRHESRIHEFYVQYSHDDWNVSVGRQRIIWGKADGGVVTDVFSPRDYTELLFTDVEDSRIGQNLVAFNYFFSTSGSADGPSRKSGPSGKNGGGAQHQISLAINHDIRADRYALAGHPYAISGFDGSLPGEGGRRFEEVGSHSPEIGIRWGVSSTGVDYSLMFADLVANQPVLSIRPNPEQGHMVSPDTSLAPTLPSFTPSYHRYQFLGAGLNISDGNFLWKMEGAFKYQRHYANAMTGESETHDGWDVAVGFDYDANGLYTASLELSHQYIVGWHEGLMSVRQYTTTMYGVLSREWLNSVLTTRYTAVFQGQESGVLNRFSLEYRMNDLFTWELEIDILDGGEPGYLFYEMRNMDRINLGIRVDF